LAVSAGAASAPSVLAFVGFSAGAEAGTDAAGAASASAFFVSSAFFSADLGSLSFDFSDKGSSFKDSAVFSDFSLS